jgi:hypothetical protein
MPFTIGVGPADIFALSRKRGNNSVRPFITFGGYIIDQQQGMKRKLLVVFLTMLPA